MANGEEAIDGLLDARSAIPNEIKDDAARIVSAIGRTEKILVYAPKKLGRQRQLIEPSPDFRIGLLPRKVTFGKGPTEAAELISYQPPVSLYERAMPPYYNLVSPLNLSTIASARIQLKNDIEALVKEQKANIICVNELGYPSYKLPHETGYDEKHEQDLLAADLELRRDLQALSDEHDCLILCGSYHDVHDLKNKAVIFAPGGSIEHQKLTSAKSDKVREVVRTPSDTKMFIYKTFLGRVGLLICFDAFDLNSFFRYALMGANDTEMRPDIILVPTWSGPPLTEVCEDLSFFANTTVIYVNGASSPYGAVFCGGEHIGPDCGASNLQPYVVPLTAPQRSKLLEKAADRLDKGIFGSMTGTFT